MNNTGAHQTLRITGFFVVFAAAVSLILFLVFGFLRSSPPNVAFQTPPGSHSINITMQVDGAVGVGPHPTWVGYWVKTPQGPYRQTTVFSVPVNTHVNVTVYEYDSGGLLRNPFWGKVQGVAGGAVDINGTPVSLINAAAGNGIAHTFVIPGLNVTVPLYGVNGNAKNFCNVGPCNPTQAHNVIKFSFFSGNKVHNYRWQCFVPCGLGYLTGNGGPMQSLGYMAGFVQVVK